jgi:hypothetical protein
MASECAFLLIGYRGAVRGWVRECVGRGWVPPARGTRAVRCCSLFGTCSLFGLFESFEPEPALLRRCSCSCSQVPTSRQDFVPVADG